MVLLSNVAAVLAVVCILALVVLLVLIIVGGFRQDAEDEIAVREQQVLDLALQLSQELQDEGLDARRAILRAAADAARRQSS